MDENQYHLEEAQIALAGLDEMMRDGVDNETYANKCQQYAISQALVSIATSLAKIADQMEDAE